MPRTYKGQNVHIVRKARKGDNGFKDDGSNQVLVLMGNNTKQVVPRDEVMVTDAPAAAKRGPRPEPTVAPSAARETTVDITRGNIGGPLRK